MRNVLAVAQRLRAARRASRFFLQVWAVDRFVIGPGLDRIARDLAAKSLTSGPSRPRLKMDGGSDRDDER